MRFLGSFFLLVFSLQAQKENPAYAKIQDVPGLPRVLVIGDSISIGYTLPVRALMQGKANVHRIPENAAHTRNGVEKIEKWLASDQRWDVIHVNFGLHDLRRMDDGLQQVSLADYEANLAKIFDRLRQTGAKLVFATTTPVPYAKTNPPRTDLDVVVYNKVARRVVEARGATVVDLYAVALPKLAEIQLPANVHFKAEGSELLAQQVAAAWQQLLAK
jgi:GDSL-like Lipase/Acylhydrolase family